MKPSSTSPKVAAPPRSREKALLRRIELGGTRYFRWKSGKLVLSLLFLILAISAQAAKVNIIEKAVNDVDGSTIAAVSVNQFIDIGTTYTTSTAPSTYSSYRFAYWTDSANPGVVYRDVWGRSLNPISFTVTVAATLTAHYLPTTRDSDGDGVPDWYEMEYFGTLANNAAADTDSDGITLLAEYTNGTSPLYGNSTLEGGVACADSALITCNLAGYPAYTLRSVPAGTVNQSGYVAPGTVITVPDLSSNSSFGYWTLDGVRQNDVWGRSLTTFSFTMAATDREAVAYLFSGDTDGDGVPDAFEQRYYGTLANGAGYDSDGDGIGMLAEYNAGTSPIYGNSTQEGGVAYADSALITANLAGYATYVLRSVPTGTVNQSGFVAPGTVVTVPDLSNNSSFGYWTLDGVRQNDAWGRALTTFSFTMASVDREAVAYLFTGDTDGDGVPDAFEQRYYGTLANGASSDSDGDGIGMLAEYNAGSSPVYANSTLEGGVAWADSGLIAADLQAEIVVEQPAGVNMTDGGSVAFGSVGVGRTLSLTFTIRNIGGTALTGLTITKDGTDAALFTVTSSPVAPVLHNQSTTFVVKFWPLTLGDKTAAIHIASNDANENPFDLSLSGTGVPVPYPVDFTLGPAPSDANSVITGAFATDASGAGDGTQFDQLQRGGYIAENGTLVFPGYLQTGLGGVDLTNFMSYWKQDAGSASLVRIARMGNDAPETGASAAKFNILPMVPGVDDDGQVTLLCSLLQSPASTPPTTADNDIGLWSELGGTGLQILIREDDVVPGLSGEKVDSLGYGCFATAKTSASTGEAAFVTAFKGASTDTALLRATITGPTVTAVGVVAREGQPAPASGENYGGLNNNVTRSVRMDASGNIVFAAGLPATWRTGIWYQSPGAAVQKAIFTGDAAPGTTATFSQLDLPNMGGNGTFAFRGVLNLDGDNSDNSKNDGIWRGSVAGGFTNILRRGDSNANRLGLFTAAYTSAYPNIKAGNIYNGWLTNANHGAWLGWVDLGGDGISAFPYDGNFSAATDTFGVYTDTSNTMKLLIASGDPVPGIAAASFFFIDHPICGGVEQVAFIATVAGSGVTSGVNEKGVWRTAPNGGVLNLAMRTGDTMSVTIAGVTTSKTIADLDLPGSNYPEHIWETPVMDGTGRLLVFVTFIDGSTTEVLVP